MSSLDISGNINGKPPINQSLIEVEESKNEIRDYKISYHPVKTNTKVNISKNQLGFKEYANIVWKQFREKIWNKVDNENKVCCIFSSICCCFIFIMLFYTFFILG